MKKTLLVLMISLAGCSQGSSIAKQQPSPSGSGGPASPGGATGAAVGGTVGATNGGATGSTFGGTSGTASGGTSGGSGGAMDSGGSGTGTGGTAGSDASVPGGTGGGLPVGPADAPLRDGPVPGTGGATGLDADGTGGTGGGPDALSADVRLRDGPVPGTGGASGTGGATGTGGTTSACIPAANPGNRGMNTGQACLGCHRSGGAAANRLFTAAGSLYSSATGGSAVSGATITIVDANSQKINIVTGSDGNFYTSSAIAFPATVQASKCPDTKAMPDNLAVGDCNSCHNSSLRIHLP